MSKHAKEDLTILGTVAGNAPPQYTEVEYSSNSWQHHSVLPPITQTSSTPPDKKEERPKAARPRQPKPPKTAITPQSSQVAKNFKRASNITKEF